MILNYIHALLGYYAAYSVKSVPSSRVKKSKKKAFFLDFLTPEDGTERLSRNGPDPATFVSNF